MSGHEHDGHANTALLHLLLERQAAFPSQAHIEDQAAGDITTSADKKCLGRIEGLHLETNRAQQTIEGEAHGLIVIDHIDHRLLRALRWVGMRPRAHLASLGDRGTRGVQVKKSSP
ncbi:hypothetical protein D9M69_621330 [compost metagenome]